MTGLPVNVAVTPLSWFHPLTTPDATTDLLLIVFTTPGTGWPWRREGEVLVEKAVYDPGQFGWIIQGGRYDGEYIQRDWVRAWANAGQVLGQLSNLPAFSLDLPGEIA